MSSKLTLEVTTVDPGEYRTTVYPPLGWGEKAQCHKVTGDIRELTVVRDGTPQFSLGIQEDGQLILTSYQGGYSSFIPQNMRLRPSNPWKTEEEQV